MATLASRPSVVAPIAPVRVRVRVGVRVRVTLASRPSVVAPIEPVRALAAEPRASSHAAAEEEEGAADAVGCGGCIAAGERIPRRAAARAAPYLGEG